MGKHHAPRRNGPAVTLVGAVAFVLALGATGHTPPAPADSAPTPPAVVEWTRPPLRLVPASGGQVNDSAASSATPAASVATEPRPAPVPARGSSPSWLQRRPVRPTTAPTEPAPEPTPTPSPFTEPADPTSACEVPDGE